MRQLPDSSVAMWEKVAKKRRLSNGWEATVGGEYFADGKPFTARLQGDKMTASMVEQFYTAVKGAANAREERKEAEAARRAVSQDVGGGREDRSTGPRDDAPGSQAAAPQAQVSVEAYLESEIARLFQRAGSLLSEAAAYDVKSRELAAEERAVRAQLEKVEAALRALKGDGK